MNNDGNTNREALPDYIRKFLQQPPQLLKNFHNEDVLAYLNLGEEQHYVQDDVILNEEQYVNSSYLIAEGRVCIWKDNIQLATLKEGSFMGETFLFSKNNRIANVVAEEESLLLKFDRHEVLNFFRRKPEKLFNIFTRNIIEIQQKKISNMNMQLLQLKKRLLNENLGKDFS